MSPLQHAPTLTQQPAAAAATGTHSHTPEHVTSATLTHSHTSAFSHTPTLTQQNVTLQHAPALTQQTAAAAAPTAGLRQALPLWLLLGAVALQLLLLVVMSALCVLLLRPL